MLADIVESTQVNLAVVSMSIQCLPDRAIVVMHHGIIRVVSCAHHIMGFRRMLKPYMSHHSKNGELLTIARQNGGDEAPIQPQYPDALQTHSQCSADPRVSVIGCGGAIHMLQPWTDALSRTVRGIGLASSEQHVVTCNIPV